MVLVAARCWCCVAFVVVAVGATGAQWYCAESKAINDAGVLIAVMLFDIMFVSEKEERDASNVVLSSPQQKEHCVQLHRAGLS